MYPIPLPPVVDVVLFPAGGSPSVGMVRVHELSRSKARRVAVRAQLLDSDRPAELLDMVRRLTLVQSDSTAAVAPSAELVAWSRLGSSSRLDDLSGALQKGILIELRGMIRPSEDLALYRAEMAEWPGSGEVPNWRQAQGAWVEINDGFRRDILERLCCVGRSRGDGRLAG